MEILWINQRLVLEVRCESEVGYWDIAPFTHGIRTIYVENVQTLAEAQAIYDDEDYEANLIFPPGGQQSGPGGQGSGN